MLCRLSCFLLSTLHWFFKTFQEEICIINHITPYPFPLWWTTGLLLISGSIPQWTCLDVSLYELMQFLFFLKLYAQERVIELLTVCILFSLQKLFYRSRPVGTPPSSFFRFHLPSGTHRFILLLSFGHYFKNGISLFCPPFPWIPVLIFVTDQAFCESSIYHLCSFFFFFSMQMPLIFLFICRSSLYIQDFDFIKFQVLQMSSLSLSYI